MCERDLFYNACVFELTAFVNIRRDVHSGGVVRDKSFEVRIHLEIIRKISVLPPFYFFCLVKLQRKYRI